MQDINDGKHQQEQENVLYQVMENWQDKKIV
jgi:hypothetical protein